MKVRIEYYKPEQINIGEVSLISLKKEKEEEQDYSESLEEMQVPNTVVIITTKEGKIVNSNVDCAYKFPFPIKIYRVGIPVEISQDSVKLNYIEVALDANIIGINFSFRDNAPFIVLETNDGSKIISASTISDVKPTIVKSEKTKDKKKKRKARKNAKKSSKKRKVKSKSSRKG